MQKRTIHKLQPHVGLIICDVGLQALHYGIYIESEDLQGYINHYIQDKGHTKILRDTAHPVLQDSFCSSWHRPRPTLLCVDPYKFTPKQPLQKHFLWQKILVFEELTQAKSQVHLVHFSCRNRQRKTPDGRGRASLSGVAVSDYVTLYMIIIRKKPFFREHIDLSMGNFRTRQYRGQVSKQFVKNYWTGLMGHLLCRWYRAPVCDGTGRNGTRTSSHVVLSMAHAVTFQGQ